MTRQSQREAVLNALQGGPKTTWQLGYGLGICCVTKRISELRKDGHVITKSEQRLSGKRVVTYRLEPSDKEYPATFVPLRSRGKFTLVCGECGTAFESAYRRSRFCGNTCRARHWKSHINPNRSGAVTPVRLAGE